ncbi:hypothetical protein GCM10010185_27300 [Saccharothrix coeruleofusca]|uniref:Winged helix-turn helix protein n=1 Tax=Saccharothrix coeruleofusca TaxID=33919 RepID=A0A918AKN6_9PSEU|nr:hypothetical protein GCM10010185_27300 [Saccharothrix coeruleofusca]
MRLRRVIVVLMSGQGRAVRDITSLMQVNEDYMRDVIHAFNQTGGVGRLSSAIRTRLLLTAPCPVLLDVDCAAVARRDGWRHSWAAGWHRPSTVRAGTCFGRFR